MSPGSERPREAANIEKWLGEARKGNQEALGRLLDICRHFLLLMAKQELKPALSAKVAPSDVVQESLMEAGRHFPRFQGNTDAELLAWLRGILRNTVADVHRHFETEMRKSAREISLANLPPIEAPLDPEDTPSGKARTSEQHEQIERALQKLPVHHRQVLVMHSIDGLTFVQIADKLGSTADAVRKLWARAAEELAKLLEPPQSTTDEGRAK